MKRESLSRLSNEFMTFELHNFLTKFKSLNNNQYYYLDDSTRVILQDSMSGDYINASYVNMKVGDLVLKYIATQGPLAV